MTIHTFSRIDGGLETQLSIVMQDTSTALQRGIQTIAHYAKTLSHKPGVYRMESNAQEILYIGKAKDLQKRVQNYTIALKLPNRLQRMVAQTTSMTFITTHTETEALLLEANLIKQHQPRYNIILKDDKAFAHICITNHKDFPQTLKFRGKRDKRGDFYGPFASINAINATLTTVQKVFKLRNCSDSYFNSRHRPCLQYHIKRCTAPCVEYITKQSTASP